MLVAEPSSAWWNTPSEERRQYRRQYNAQAEAHAKKLARQARYYYRHRERRLDIQRMINYRCTPEAYRAMLEAQGGKCAICREAPTARFKGRLKQLSVDHDHITGRIRALLCSGCNAGLGHFRNNPFFLIAAAQYLAINSST
jgi:Recombination endonuclease VII